MARKRHAQVSADPNFASCLEEEFVDNLVSDPTRLPDVTVIGGFLGKSARGDDWWRLYLSLDLKAFLEFKEEHIVRAQPTVPGQSMAGSVVWLRSEADVWHVGVRTRHVNIADFARARMMPYADQAPRAAGDLLQGPMTAQGLPQSSAQNFGILGAIPQASTLPPICPPSWWVC